MAGLRNGHILKNLTKMVNPRDIAGERRRRRSLFLVVAMIVEVLVTIISVVTVVAVVVFSMEIQWVWSLK